MMELLALIKLRTIENINHLPRVTFLTSGNVEYKSL